MKRQKIDKLLRNAVTYQQAGELLRAIDAYRRYLKQDPENAGVLHTLGGLYCQTGDMFKAVEFLEKAHRAAPDNLDYLNDLGACRLMTGDYPAAIVTLETLVLKAPDNALAAYNLGLALSGADRVAEAINAFRESVRLKPDFAPAWFNLGVTCQVLGYYDEALGNFRKAIEFNPGLAQAYFKLGEVLAEQKQYAESLSAFKKAHELNKNDPGIIVALGNALHESGQTEDAIKLMRFALEKSPGTGSLLVALARHLQIAGNIKEAEDLFREALSIDQVAETACAGFSRIRKFNHKDIDIIHSMEALLENNNLSETQRMDVYYALGKVRDDCGDYDTAFHCYSNANAIQHKRVFYDKKAYEQRIGDSIALFTPQFFREFSDIGTQEDRPVFIVGMPRSGTTLTEQIIASHPQVEGGGELLYFSTVCGNLPAILEVSDPWPLCCMQLNRDNAGKIIRHYLDLLSRHSATARYVTDKLPGNYHYLGLIRVLFPNAHIIHCRRNPYDTCLSIFFQNFSSKHEYAADLIDIGHRYLHYVRLMTHWRQVLPGPFMEIKYEDLISDQESFSRKLISFCNLEWDNRCLTFYDKRRDIMTASQWQVRQPIYSGSAGRWHHYEKYLKPLVQLLADAGDEL